MKFPNRFALTVWLALIGGAAVTTASSAQKTDAASRSAEIAELSWAGKYSEAIPLAQRLLADMEQDHGIKPMIGFGNPLFDPSQTGGDKPRRCARRCSSISAIPRRSKPPVRRSGVRCVDRRGRGALSIVDCASQQNFFSGRSQL